ncbi:hypothetical protein [Xanthobacter autotrophicus]|uniref:hypothetical protein n=1 Tax=Xanthobacter autotrophicus TaxID=280 RepID=UPI00372B540A
MTNVTLIYDDILSKEVIDDFRKIVGSGGINFKFVDNKRNVAMASLEWLMPTAVVIYIVKSYFDGFLNEAGKDHYRKLKDGIKFIGEKLKDFDIVKVGASGNASRSKFSRTYSIWFEAESGIRFKCLFYERLSKDDMDNAIDVFLKTIQKYYDGGLDGELGRALSEANPVAGIILISCDHKSGTVEIVDPVPSSVTPPFPPATP